MSSLPKGLRPIAALVLGYCAGWCDAAVPGGDRPQAATIEVGAFETEVRTFFDRRRGLPDDQVASVVVGPGGVVFAGTSGGVARFENGSWHAIPELPGEVGLLATDGRGLLVLSGTTLYRWEGSRATVLARGRREGAAKGEFRCLAAVDPILAGAADGLYALEKGEFVPVSGLNRLLAGDREVRQIAAGPGGQIAVAAKSGLYVRGGQGTWEAVYPRTQDRSWAPYDVRGAAYDARGRLWFASVQGAGCLDGEKWALYTGQEGLPYNDFTALVAGEKGVVWFATKIGAIRFDGDRWFYRQGLRWLPHDDVRSIAVTDRGNAWFATPQGVGLIERRSTTLAEKARLFEEAIDKHHRRTPFGYVLSVSLKNPGDTSEWIQHDSDNDGLWTSMYGAGECFAYAATKDPRAKQRAQAALEAVRFLSQVTQGGSHPAPPGFPARTILPTDGEDPNKVQYTAEKDQQRQKGDPLWKVIVPRWPTSADGKWYWKCDTSSDELDGHFFLYALYHDLVAETDAEKARAREVILAVTDHLIDHDFELIDHDGKPTRWARFGPKVLNGGLFWAGRGLNSLSILSYLKVADHVSGGGRKYREAYERLVRDHSYASNVLDPKLQNGPGSGNQSDDEMAFMCFYNLLKYENDAGLRKLYDIALRRYWALEAPEACPLFNFLFAASFGGATAWDVEGMGIPAYRVPRSCFEDAIDTLKRYPLDRIRWGYRNSHRIDVMRFPSYLIDARGRACRRDGKALPIDERFVEYWNHDPWRLDEGGDGRSLADGASFLLPYYLGLYHRFLRES